MRMDQTSSQDAYYVVNYYTQKELEYISNCKNLIKIFERKIKDKLSEVWGE